MKGRAAEELLAKMAVRQTLEQYFSSIDRKDWPLVAACFTEDAKAEMDAHGDSILIGRGAIANQIKTWMVEMMASHTLSNAHIVVDGDTAEAEIRTVATLVMGREPERRILVRGITYFDKLVLNRDGYWEISHRIHRAVWQYAQEWVAPEL